MNERLLHFIWQFRYFNMSELTTTSGAPVHVLHPGSYNTDQGPDFSQARIRIGKAVWAGNVELHVQTSDWEKHGHQFDPNYNNTILHVVWHNDAPAGQSIPVVELKDRVSGFLLDRYEQLMRQQGFIACERLLPEVPGIITMKWRERLLAERLLKRSAIINRLVAKSNGHWEECFWWVLARAFGMKVNADAFEEVARSVPVNILARHKHQVQQLEAMLLGQAGLLHGRWQEAYPRLLQKEYSFLRRKYGLQRICMPVHFLRMRPGNFPTIRLAQLAMLVSESVHLFSFLREIEDVAELRGRLDITANDYWHYHYRFDQLTPFREKHTGISMVNHVIINAVVPVLFAFGTARGDTLLKQKAIHWLEQTPPEQNRVTRGFQALGMANTSAFDSQALLELKEEYCDPVRCLECAVGNAVLHSKLPAAHEHTVPGSPSPGQSSDSVQAPQ